jgi:hypothetical protein
VTPAARRRLTLALALLTAAGGAIFLVSRWVSTVAKLAAPSKSLEEMEAQLRALHRGEGPCLRWPEPPPPEATSAAAADLLNARVTPRQVSPLAVLFLDWNDDSEARHHDASKSDEQLAAMGVGPLQRLVFRPMLRRMESKSALPRMRKQAEEAWRQTPAVEQEGVRAAYERHPSAFTLPGLIRLLGAMREKLTEERLDVLAAALRARTAPPERLADLGLPDDALRDGWDQDFKYEPGVSISSLGRDGVPGGEGDDADRVRSLADVPTGAHGGSDAPPAPTRCGALPARATLSSRDVDRALTHTEELANQARIVPFFEGGVCRGFKIFAIRPGSLFERVGLCNGDVVSRIDGYDIASPDKALEVYAHMKGRKRVDVEIVRGGARHSLEIVIR